MPPATTPPNAPSATTRRCPTCRPTPSSRTSTSSARRSATRSSPTSASPTGRSIGSLYADRFPDRIRAMVLDGAIDPSIDLEQFRAGQAAGFEKALTAFLDDCAARTACAFHEGGKSAAAFDSLMASIDAKSLPRPSHTIADRSDRGSPTTPCSRLSTSRSRGRSWRARSPWPSAVTARCCSRSPTRTGVASPNGSYSNLHDAYTANTCLDFAAPDGRRHVHRLGEAAQGVGATFRRAHRLQRPCLRVLAGPARTDAGKARRGDRCAADRGHRHDRRSGDALRLGRALAKELDSAVLVTHEGEGHTAISATRASSGRSTPTCWD